MKTMKFTTLKAIFASLLLLFLFTTLFSQIHADYNLGYNLPDSIYKPYSLLNVWEDPVNYEETDEITYYKFEKHEVSNWPDGVPIPPDLFRPTIYKYNCFFDSKEKLQLVEYYGFDHDIKKYEKLREAYFEYNENGKNTYYHYETLWKDGEPLSWGFIEVTQNKEYDENDNLLTDIREADITSDIADGFEILKRYDTLKYDYSYDEENDIIIQNQLILNRKFPSNIYRTCFNDTVIEFIKEIPPEFDLSNDSTVFVDSLEYLTKIYISENNDSIIATSYVINDDSEEIQYNLFAQTIYSYYKHNDTTIITDIRIDADSNGDLYTVPRFKKVRTYKDEKLVHSINERIQGNSVYTSCSFDTCTAIIGKFSTTEEIVHYYDENGFWLSSAETIISHFPDEENSAYYYYYKTLPDDVLKSTLTSINESISNVVSIYPNPSNNIITIDIAEAIEDGTISVADISGKIVEHISINRQSKIILDVSQYEIGIYFLRINNGTENHIEKIAVY